MQRDGFTCLHCQDKTKTLNVHHIVYKPKCDPWEYPEEDLATLCGDCHASIHSTLEIISRLMVIRLNSRAFASLGICLLGHNNCATATLINTISEHQELIDDCLNQVAEFV